MKKLLVVAMLALLSTYAIAQSVLITSTHTQAEIQFRVKFVGLKLTFHADGGAGAATDHSLCSGATITTWSVVSTYTLRYSASDVCPCDAIAQVLWVENTGGLTADIYGYRSYWRITQGSADDDWTASATATTVCPSYNDYYKFFAKFNPSTGSATHSAGSAVGTTLMTPYNSYANRYHFVDELWAEDPANLGDGTWTNGAVDQRDIDLFLKLPPGVDAHDLQTDIHVIRLVLNAEVD